MSYFRRLGAALVGRPASPVSRGPYRPLDGKASAVGALISRTVLGQPVWPGRDLARLAEEGYRQNPVVSRAVDLIASGVAGIGLEVVKGRGAAATTYDTHPLLDRLAAPNPTQDGTSLIHALIANLVITGNGYLERTNETRIERMELYALRPDRVRVVPGADGFLEGWEYHAGGDRKRFIAKPERGISPILHMRRFHPLDDWYGMSALDPAAWSIDVHAAAAAHNKAVLENGAAPSGAFVYEGNPEGGNRMPDEMFERTRLEIDEMTRAAERGRPLMLEGGLKWLPMGLNLEQMQFVESKMLAAREIAFALGVPPMLLGLPGDNTYANYAEANRAFHRSTVIPMAEWLCRALTQWFRPVLGDGVRLVPDLDTVHALAIERNELWDRLEKSSILTLNEKREALGYGHVDGGDEHYVEAGKLPVSAEAVIAGGPPPEDPPDDATDAPDDVPDGESAKRRRLRVVN